LIINGLQKVKYKNRASLAPKKSFTFFGVGQLLSYPLCYARRMENMKYYYIPGLTTRYSASRRGLNAAIRRAALIGTRVMCHNIDGIEEVVYQVPRTCPKCGVTC